MAERKGGGLRCVDVLVKLLDSASMLLWRIGSWVAWLQGLVKLHRYRLSYESRPDDVFIVTYPKSGTTWLQMILYQLTSDGRMDFQHINTKSPHFEEEFIDRNRRFEDLAPPRIFKSHLPYAKIPKGRGKYIYVMRDGLDVAVSYFYHYKAYKRFAGTFDQFFERFLDGEVAYGSWFEHLSGWLPNRAGLDVLFIRYEDLRDDLEGAIQRIAEFCGQEARPADLSRIVERCRFDFMKRHEEKFDLAHGFLTKHGFGSNRFLRKGETGDWRNHLSADQERKFLERFERRLAGLGLKDYCPCQAPNPDP